MNFKRLGSFLLSVLLLATLITPKAIASNDELERAKQDKKNIAEEKAALQSQVDRKKASIDEVISEMQRLDDAIAGINTVIEELDIKIEEKNQDIEEVKQELVKAQQELEEMEEDLNSRVRVMYMYGNDGYLELLFSSEDFSDFISRADKMAAIMKADKKSVRNIEDKRNEIEVKKDEIEEALAEIEESKEKQVEAKDEQEAKKTEQEAVRAANQQEIDTFMAEIEEKDAAEAEADAKVQQIVAEQQAELERIRQEKQAAAQQGEPDPHPEVELPSETSPTGYLWPVPGVYYITSPFGPRSDVSHFGGSSYHNGIDIGASTGTPCVAIADGVVTEAAYTGGYGNLVIIDFGGGVSGYYGHLNGYAVSAGERVSAGQTVGYVGSTGISSGPHLHFGMLINGGWQNPMNYLPY